jgi:Right handed beta helix region
MRPMNPRHAFLASLMLAVWALSACGGGASGTAAIDTPAAQGPAPAPAPTSAPAPSPTTGSGLTYYFSDCQTGAHGACVPGDNSNAGTDAAAPKRDLTGFDVNTLPAGSQLLLAQGGKWINFSLFVYNTHATPNQPLVFASYAPAWGGTARPWLVAAYEQTAFTFGGAPATGDPQRAIERDGGYTLRGLRLQGLGRTDPSVVRPDYGLMLLNRTRDVVLEDIDIAEFGIGIYTDNALVGGILDLNNLGNLNVVLRNSHIHHNTRMGLLGDADGYTIEGNTFTGNNLAPVGASGFNHAIYLAGHGRRGVVRNNTFTNNSVHTMPNSGGAQGCVGGNLTVHGQWDDLLIEGNTITQDVSYDSCYGISVTTGYGDRPEHFNQLVVRGNVIVNLGGCAICVEAATAPLIENNRLINHHDRWMSGVVMSRNQPPGGLDHITSAATVRNNVYCGTHGRRDHNAVLVDHNSPTVVTVNEGNVERYGSGAMGADTRCIP